MGARPNFIKIALLIKEMEKERMDYFDAVTLIKNGSVENLLNFCLLFFTPRICNGGKITGLLESDFFNGAIKNTNFIMTDSGVIQEGNSFLGIPCLTIRENTERPVTVEKGTNTLCNAKKGKE